MKHSYGPILYTIHQWVLSDCASLLTFFHWYICGSFPLQHVHHSITDVTKSPPPTHPHTRTFTHSHTLPGQGRQTSYPLCVLVLVIRIQCFSVVWLLWIHGRRLFCQVSWFNFILLNLYFQISVLNFVVKRCYFII